MSKTSRAAQALAVVLARVPEPDASNGHFRILDSWTESDDTICVVYEGWWTEAPTGLRRRLDPDLSVNVMAGQILDAELGEPPGAMLDGVDPDANGIRWWEGEPPEWWKRDLKRRQERVAGDAES